MIPTLFSVSYAGFWGQAALDLKAFVSRAAALGYPAVMLMGKRPHLSVLDDDAETVADLAAHCRAAGVSVACVAGYTNFAGGAESGDRKYPGRDEIGELAWIKGNSAGKTHYVAGKKPNELGFYDLAGNVSEWCWFGAQPDKKGELPDRIVGEFFNTFHPKKFTRYPNNKACVAMGGSYLNDDPSSFTIGKITHNKLIEEVRATGLRVCRNAE